MPQNRDELLFLVADGSVKMAEKAQVLRRSTIRQEHVARGELHNDVFQGESYEPQP